MKLFKQVFNFYLDASIHVALAVVCLYFISLQLLKVSTNYDLVGFLFFGTIVCYNFMKFGVEAKKYIIVSNPYHRLIQIFSFLAFSSALYFFLQLDNNLWFSILILILISALYAIPFLPQTKNLRSLGGMKVYLVALVWMGCTVILPVLDANLSLTGEVFLLMTQRVLLVLILLIPFEIRDLKYDEPSLRTLPQRIGILKTKSIGYVLIVAYFSLQFFKTTALHAEWISLVMFSLLLFAIIKMTKEDQSKFFASFWVEVLPLVYLMLLVMVKAVY